MLQEIKITTNVQLAGQMLPPGGQWGTIPRYLLPPSWESSFGTSESLSRWPLLWFATQPHHLTKYIHIMNETEIWSNVFANFKKCVLWPSHVFLDTASQ